MFQQSLRHRHRDAIVSKHGTKSFSQVMKSQVCHPGILTNLFPQLVIEIVVKQFLFANIQATNIL